MRPSAAVHFHEPMPLGGKPCRAGFDLLGEEDAPVSTSTPSTVRTPINPCRRRDPFRWAKPFALLLFVAATTLPEAPASPAQASIPHRVLAGRLNVRAGPSLDDQITSQLARGAVVCVVSEASGRWLKILFESSDAASKTTEVRSGFASRGFLGAIHLDDPDYQLAFEYCKKLDGLQSGSRFDPAR